ncbi:hypothetical protein V5799_003439 [Amblyomma americanum]|uniref:THAP-type domain-containing protein n=1 Tax=Amblyomma americanum TaxID=6943 RepID=A0AAQ4D8Y9_AMBAM
MSTVKRPCKERTCFVPVCQSGYRSSTESVSLFTASTDHARLVEWEKNIRREDRRLSSTAVVCEKHSESSFIERTFKITVNGIVNEIPRDKPRLKPDAVPTVFDAYPKHLVPPKSVKKKTRNLCEQEAPPKRPKKQKQQQHDDGEPRESAEEAVKAQVGSVAQETLPASQLPSFSGAAATSFLTSISSENRHPFDGILIPARWMKIPALPADTFAFACCDVEENNFMNLFIEKVVRLGKPLPERGCVVAAVYLRGKERCKQLLKTRNEAELLIAETEKAVLCSGVGTKPLSGKYR